jgi:hypothetical protein
MSNADKRTVTTDALETLGTIITENEKRDAIHLAVEPVVAGETLYPGQHIGLVAGVAIPTAPDRVGIVDPFIKRPVQAGERFWLVVYPRQITSLRHVWTHPAFEDVPEVKEVSDKAASEKWLRDFCASADCPGYETTLGMAVAFGERGGRYGNEDYLHFDDLDAHGNIPPEFWDHVEIVTGKKMTHRATYFSCSC